MGKVKKTKRKFNYQKNRKKVRAKQKKVPGIQCPQIKQAWDKKKSLKQNMADMGLSTDPNVTIAIPKAKDLMGPQSEFGMEVEAPIAMRLDVARALEKESKLVRKLKKTMPEPDAKYCIYMMEKHGEDYKAMAKDHKNYYQDTPKQIRGKIMKFKQCKEQYQEYLTSKQTGTTMDTN